MSARDLQRVERAAAKYQQARADLETAVIQAKRNGHGIRPIAAAAGMGREWTRKLTSR